MSRTFWWLFTSNEPEGREGWSRIVSTPTGRRSSCSPHSATAAFPAPRDPCTEPWALDLPVALAYRTAGPGLAEPDSHRPPLRHLPHLHLHLKTWIGVKTSSFFKSMVLATLTRNCLIKRVKWPYKVSLLLRYPFLSAISSSWNIIYVHICTTAPRDWVMLCRKWLFLQKFSGKKENWSECGTAVAGSRLLLHHLQHLGHVEDIHESQVLRGGRRGRWLRIVNIFPHSETLLVNFIMYT